MDYTASFLSYGQTGYFSKMVLDYIEQVPGIQPFYSHHISLDGVRSSIAAREKFDTNRKLLVSELKKQYASLEPDAKVVDNIELLQNKNTYTICTAHQPNIFTVPLYFIYKILHVIKLAEELKIRLPEKDFVPVYYMGSEDADLEELGHFYIDGEKYKWETGQKGAVGRMKVDQNLVQLLERVSGQLSIEPFGAEIIELMKGCYQVGITIESATFRLVNQLFADFGLVILLPDNRELKASFTPVIEKELMGEFSHLAVQQTVEKFPADYKVQASGRALNMFYLIDDKRERIELSEGVWSVVNTDLQFTKEQIITELKEFPERFSPNVILRPVFQEWILPNIAFVGGGGEISYWLQLKKVFDLTGTPYPLLLLRNSFMIVNKEMKHDIDKLNITDINLFKEEQALFDQLVKRDSVQQLNLDQEQLQFGTLYEHLQVVAGKIDPTLKIHTAALQTKALKKIIQLEKKMLRAERRKFEATQRHLKKIKSVLFPTNNLQERIDNLMPYYALSGREFIKMVYDHSKGLEQQFGILVEIDPLSSPEGELFK